MVENHHFISCYRNILNDRADCLGGKLSVISRKLIAKNKNNKFNIKEMRAQRERK